MKFFTTLKHTLVCILLLVMVIDLNAQCYTCGTDNNSSLGTNNTVSGQNSAALGSGNTVTGNNSVAMGTANQITGINSLVLGANSNALNNYSFALGNYATADGIRAISIGANTYAKDYSIAIGNYATSNASTCYSFGNYVESNASGAITIGYTTATAKLINNKMNSLMIGFNSTLPTLFIGDSPSSTTTGKVGIGTTEPVAKLQITDGDVYIEDIGSGIIMKSPDGQCWRGKLSNTGVLEFNPINCENLTAAIKAPEKNSEEFQVFPNPGSGFFTVTIPNTNMGASLNIYNMDGVCLLKKTITTKNSYLDLTHFAKGTYLVEFVAEGMQKRNQTLILN